MLNSKKHLFHVSTKEISESMTHPTKAVYLSLCPESFSRLLHCRMPVREGKPLLKEKRNMGFVCEHFHHLGGRVGSSCPLEAMTTSFLKL